ncbi:MAG: hypothetical protein M1818_007289 [Claussenomyces sp. TS43310]|nr:MAG: hypothetical protein M1818_007289 [Claussenomyces sp. TS43310]
MLCSLSGESPQNPAVSSKSGRAIEIVAYKKLILLGNVFERRLIEAYISENGKDPVTGEEMSIDDLIDLKTDRTVRPRPPTLTSIPSLLAVFQNEWDALALDSYNIRQQLSQTRQELATALYQHDAAVRVITRLTRERDEARDALSKITIGAGDIGSADQMQVDGPGLPEDLAERVDATQAQLSKSRRKRPVPKDWASADAIESFTVTTQSEPLYPGTTSLAVDAAGEHAIVGGSDGIAGVYSLLESKMIQPMKVGGSITDALWYRNQPIVASSSGAVKVFDDGNEIAAFTSHAGSATALAMHPSSTILASVGIDKSFVFYDLVAVKPVTQVYTDCGLTAAAFHPDGHLFAAGGSDGQVRMYHTKTGEFAAQFDCGAFVQDISFSENGFLFATATKGSTSTTIFDLRKEGKAAEFKVIDIGNRVDCIRWDYSGQFLATAGPSGITVHHYTKSTKAWSEPLRSAVPATAVEWGMNASSLISVNVDGVISVLGSQ